MWRKPGRRSSGASWPTVSWTRYTSRPTTRSWRSRGHRRCTMGQPHSAGRSTATRNRAICPRGRTSRS
eukprot:7134115-Lingulodinium_polyedra.AAC.1